LLLNDGMAHVDRIAELVRRLVLAGVITVISTMSWGEPVVPAIFASALRQGAASAAATTYRVDPSTSRATIHVGKAGAFSFVAGHTHRVTAPVESGLVDVDLAAPERSHVRLAFDAANLKVSPEGEPEGDAPKVQAAMDDHVLDVAHHPRINYESTGVTLTARRASGLDLDVNGRLTIRSVSQTVRVPVRVQLSGDRLTATGRFSIKQSSFGIKPISVGGVVSVKDAVDVDFSIVATR
jgi:polyisoprenoid-binding protein YceI